MVVTTTVKGYFHITAESLEVAQAFIDIVNDLHPEQYEWSTEIGPYITLWKPQPDNKMCYGIPFKATHSSHAGKPSSRKAKEQHYTLRF